MDLDLNDKVAIVTGGSRGLGRAISLQLAEEGCRVAVNYVRGREAALAVVDEIHSTCQVPAVAIGADVSLATDVARLFDETESQMGPCDLLINNAGTWPTAFVRDMSEAEFRETMDVNLVGPFLTCREAVRRWVDGNRQGRIVNITSQAAFHGATSGHAHYAAAKSGLVTFSISLAREVAKHGIAVNLLAPGLMVTDMAREAYEQDPQRYLARIPLGRAADPAEMANVAVFLCSDRASYMTGATVDVSGGMLMR
jgi:3-oxoacyl-[acyl-carrier protein] reductase